MMQFVQKLQFSVFFFSFKYFSGYRLVGVVHEHIAAGVGSTEFDSRVGQIGYCRQRLSTAATFVRSCVVKART